MPFPNTSHSLSDVLFIFTSNFFKAFAVAKTSSLSNKLRILIFPFTIEPIINQGVANTAVSNQDNWTVFTLDKKNSAQWEHTLAVTSDGLEVFTARPGEPWYRNH